MRVTLWFPNIQGKKGLKCHIPMEPSIFGVSFKICQQSIFNLWINQQRCPALFNTYPYPCTINRHWCQTVFTWPRECHPARLLFCPFVFAIFVIVFDVKHQPLIETYCCILVCTAWTVWVFLFWFVHFSSPVILLQMHLSVFLFLLLLLSSVLTSPSSSSALLSKWFLGFSRRVSPLSRRN